LKAKRENLVHIRTPAQWRAMGSPVRVEMLEVMRRLGPLSLAEVAQRLDRPADGLYHHARVLLSAGIIRVVERRTSPRAQRNGARPEAVYELAGKRIKVDLSSATGAKHSPLLRMIGSLHRASLRALATAQSAGRLNDPPTNWSYGWEVAWLNKSNFKKVRKHLDAIVEILDAGRASSGGALYHLQTLAIPVARRRGAARSSN
jgi:DNA-binding transcriptional ArsR family regulator